MVSDDSQAAGSQLVSQVMQLVRGFVVSQAIHVAAKLAIFDEVRDGPKTTDELAAVTQSQAPALRRLLRFLTSVDLLSEDEQGRFSTTALGCLLQSDHPQSARSYALMYGEPFIWRAWGDLYETVRTGNPGFERVHGESFFDYLAGHPVDAAIFNAGMTSASSLDLASIVNAYDFSAFDKIVDVGGGHGALLKGILERFPNSAGVLCDLPSVVADASEINGSSVARRCELVGIDMFQSVPAGGDAYVLKRILHDWNDAEAIRILQNCRHAIAERGRLLVMEAVVKPPNQRDPAKAMDLNMLVLLSGRERTEDEFREIFTQAGFRLTRVVPVTDISIIEGVPA